MDKINQLYTFFCAIFIFCIASQEIFAQGVIIDDQNSGTEPDETALLHLESKTKGAVFPRMTESQRSAISTPVEGLLVYQIDGKQGHYYYDGSAWQQIPSQEGAAPTGAIMIYAGENITNTALMKDGWHKCDGTLVSKTDLRFKGLFDVIGTNWGGTPTQFKMPDLRGMFLRGANHGRSGSYSDTDTGSRSGGSSVDKVGSVQSDEIKAHRHGPGTLKGVTNTLGAHTHNYTYADGSNTTDEKPLNSNSHRVTDKYLSGTTSSNGLHKHDIDTGGWDHSTSTTTEGGEESRPNNVYVYYIIKL